MKAEIKLYSRGVDNRLVRIGSEDSTKYKLETPHYYRMGYSSDNNYMFIDPSGGPFMAIGTEIDGHKIRKIHDGGIIEFEE